jgi:hypothetical protein
VTRHVAASLEASSARTTNNMSWNVDGQIDPPKSRSRHGLALVVMIIASFGNCMASHQPETRPRCDMRNWGVQLPMTGPSQSSLYLESGELQRIHDTLWIVGAPTLAWDYRGAPLLRASGDSETPHFAGARFLVRRDSGLEPLGLTPLPPGVWRMQTPRVASLPDGSLHAAFVIPRTSAGSAHNEQVIWSSSWQNGRWTAPQELLDSNGTAMWSSSTVSRVSSEGSSPMLTVMGTHSRRSALHLLRATSARGWTSESIRYTQGFYPQIIEGLLAGTLLLSYVDAGTRSGRNTVFLNRSLDGGATWGRPFEFGSHPSAEAYSPVLIRSEASRLHLVWVERLADSGSGTRLRMMTSANDGRTWVEVEPLGLPFDTRRITASVGSQGEVHLLSAEESGARVRLLHSAWDGDWATTIWTLSNRLVGYPSLAVLNPDQILITWGMAGNAPGGAENLPRTWYRLGTVACRARADNQ